MVKLLSISGKKFIRAFGKLGFVVIRQKGSHVILQKGSNLVTIPLHDLVKKSTLIPVVELRNDYFCNHYVYNHFSRDLKILLKRNLLYYR